ncbi:MAG: tRNA 2-thiocytidine biosynthesis protein TtcA [Oscillospiraceae bacterium]|nr:tRNA 2-thiocytidine biosynthesis protein TtcA [Oscillospiraceae bacterium]
MGRELAEHEIIERSIIKKYRKEIWNPFTYAVKKYELIREGDSIAVCISGGKDSMLLAKLMQEIHAHGGVPFTLKFIVMDPGYNPANRAKIEGNLAKLNIDAEIFTSDIFDIANNAGGNPCYLCARMRRGTLYAKAREIGCTKIALGHHFNDVIETTVMGMFFGAQIQAMLPKLHSTNFPGMELIRPMYCIHEEDILAWCRYNGLSFIQCACRFTEHAAKDETVSKRKEVKELLRFLKKDNPDIEKSIFNSIHTVSLDTMVGWKTKGEEHTFLEHYYDT